MMEGLEERWAGVDRPAFGQGSVGNFGRNLLHERQIEIKSAGEAGLVNNGPVEHAAEAPDEVVYRRGVGVHPNFVRFTGRLVEGEAGRNRRLDYGTRSVGCENIGLHLAPLAVDAKTEAGCEQIAQHGANFSYRGRL